VISRRTQLVMLILVVVATFLLSALWQNLTRQAELRAKQDLAASPVVSERAWALTVLRAWDKKRAEAYAEANPRALRGLYGPGSVSGANDVTLLRRYAERDLRVEGMDTQILGIEVIEHTDDSLVLVVTDRLSAAFAVGKDFRQVLPRDEVNTRRISLVLVAGSWVVAEVDAEETSQPRPAESTARTSGS
jgi:hypothetical protein